MTKDELIFSVVSDIQQQAPTQDGAKRVHPLDVEKKIAEAYESAVIQFFANPQISSGYDLDYFSKTYTLALGETASGQLYVTLPVSPLALPRGLGVRMVRPENSNVVLVRMSEGEFMNAQYQESFCCSPVPFCYVDVSAGRVVVQTDRPEYKLMDNLTVKLLPKFNDFDSDDEINSPGGDYSITQMVLQIMGIRPTDSTNDDEK